MLSTYVRIGHAPTDSARERRAKSVFALAMIGMTLFAVQLLLFEDRTTLERLIDGLAMVATLGSLGVLQLGKRIDRAYAFVAGLGLAVLAASLLLVGNRNGDLFFLPMIPVFAVAVLGARRSLSWFAVTLAAVVIVAAGQAYLPDLASPLHRSAVNPQGLLFHGPARDPISGGQVVALLTGLTLVYFVSYSAANALNQANKRIESLLLNVLPSSIAARLTDETRRKLREDGAGIADEFSESTILFADIVGFTDLAAKTSTAELMKILDAVFTEFDHLAEKHQVEKIKTIGDAYMAVCGLPQPNPDHARNIADMALEMLDVVRRYRDASGTPVRLRIGINSGPVIAGIIGRKKFIYDLWGDAVNVASRMESNGAPGTIQVSSATRDALEDAYDFEPLGTIEVKGKGQLPAWRLLGPKARDPA